MITSCGRCIRINNIQKLCIILVTARNFINEKRINKKLLKAALKKYEAEG